MQLTFKKSMKIILMHGHTHITNNRELLAMTVILIVGSRWWTMQST